MRVVGLNPLKGCVYYSEAEGPPFAILDRNRIMFDGDAPAGLVTLAEALKAFFEAARDHGIDKVTICDRSTYSSSAEAIKGQAIVEVVACQLGCEVSVVSPQRLKKVLGGNGKWQDLAAEKLNPAKSEQYWSQGMNGAFAAAFAGFAP